jgi:hypothetical protein
VANKPTCCNALLGGTATRESQVRLGSQGEGRGSTRGRFLRTRTRAGAGRVRCGTIGKDDQESQPSRDVRIELDEMVLVIHLFKRAVPGSDGFV